MWVTHTERAWRRAEEARGLAEAARLAEARIAGASNALRAIQADREGRLLFARAGFALLSLGRSSRVSRNGRVEGLTVLEAVILARSFARVLSSPQLVLWLSKQYPKELAALNSMIG
jgi:hypothetical protein